MKFPRTIGIRITLGFGLLIIAIIFNAILSHRVVDRMQATQQELTGILNPSIRELINLRNIVLVVLIIVEGGFLIIVSTTIEDWFLSDIKSKVWKAIVMGVVFMIVLSVGYKAFRSVNLFIVNLL